MPIITVPDVGDIEFPDDMSSQEIEQALNKLFPPEKAPEPKEKTNILEDLGSGLRNAAEMGIEGVGMGLAGLATINPVNIAADKLLGADIREPIFAGVKALRDARAERESKVDRGEMGKVMQAVGAIPTYLNPLTAGAAIAGSGVNTGLTMMEQGADVPHALAGQTADTALSLAGMKLGDLANVASPVKNALLQGGINVAQEAAVAHPVENVIRRHAGIQERPDMTPGDYAAAFVPGAVIGGMTAKSHKPAEQPLPEKEVTPRTQTEEDLVKLRGNETSIFKRATFIQDQLSRFPEQMSEKQFELYTRLQEELEGLSKEFKENRTNIERYEDALKTPEQKQAEEQTAIQAIREADMGVAGNPTAKQAKPVVESVRSVPEAARPSTGLDTTSVLNKARESIGQSGSTREPGTGRRFDINEEVLSKDPTEYLKRSVESLVKTIETKIRKLESVTHDLQGRPSDLRDIHLPQEIDFLTKILNDKLSGKETSEVVKPTIEATEGITKERQPILSPDGSTISFPFKTKLGQEPETLIQTIRRLGGLSSKTLTDIGISKGKKDTGSVRMTVSRPKGHDLSAMVEYLEAEGFVFRDPENKVLELEELIHEAANGNKVYTDPVAAEEYFSKAQRNDEQLPSLMKGLKESFDAFDAEVKKSESTPVETRTPEHLVHPKSAENEVPTWGGLIKGVKKQDKETAPTEPIQSNRHTQESISNNNTLIKELSNPKLVNELMSSSHLFFKEDSTVQELQAGFDQAERQRDTSGTGGGTYIGLTPWLEGWNPKKHSKDTEDWFARHLLVQKVATEFYRKTGRYIDSFTEYSLSRIFSKHGIKYESLSERLEKFTKEELEKGVDEQTARDRAVERVNKSEVKFEQVPITKTTTLTEASTPVIKPQETPITKPSLAKTTTSPSVPPIVPPTKPKVSSSKPPSPVVEKQQTAQQIAKTLDDPLYDIDVSKTRTAEEVVQDLKQREGVVDRAYKLGRELFGSQQLVEAVKREAPVVWEIYKRIKKTNEAVTAMKYRWMYGDIPQTPDGKGPIMTLAHREAMDSIAVVKRSLTDNEKQRVHEQMMKTFASRTKHTDVDLSHLSPKEQQAVRVLTDMYERVLNDRGLKQRNGYMHTNRKGDFSVGVKNLLGDVTHVEFWPSRKDALEFIRRAKEKGFETTDILDLKSEQGMKFAEAFETINDILEQVDVGMNTPETRAHMEALQSFLADNAKGVHNLRKMGYSGGVGSKLLKSNRENALDWWDSIEGYLAEMATQQKKIMLNKQSVDFFDGEAGIELKKMVPNQVETAKYLMDIAMNNQKKYGVADQIDSIKKEIDALLVSTVRSGIGAAKQIPFFGKKITADEKLWYPNVPITDKATGIAAEFFYVRTLTSRPAFWAGQLLSSPFALRQFLKEGTVLDTLKAQGKGMATFMSGGDAEFRAFLKDISNTSETLIPQLHTEINELPIFGRHGNPTLSKVYELMTGKTPAATADTLSRYMTLSIAYHFYKDMGMSGKQLQENVKQMVDDTMVVYSRAYTPPFLTKLGFAGQHIAPLQKYGLAQLQHLIGDIKHIKDVGTFKSTLPLMSTLMTTMIMSGSIGLPLLMEYEILRLALLKGGEFFGIKNMEDYLPASVMEMMLTNNRVKDAFAAGLSNFGVSEDTAKKTVSHGVVSAVTGMDIGSSLRFNPFIPEPGEEISLLNAFPIVKSVLETGAQIGTKVKKKLGGDVTLAEERKADLFLGGHVVGGKAIVDETKYDANTRDMVPGGNRNYAQVPQTDQERMATLLGTQTVDTRIAKAEEKIRRSKDQQLNQKKQKVIDLIMDGIQTGNDEQVSRNMEKAAELGMTYKEIMRQIKSSDRNRKVPSLIRRFTNEKGQISTTKQKREYLEQEKYQ